VLCGQLSALLPELVIKVVHGSMDRNEVEETLVQFAMGKGTTHHI
jgi:transcription-repair coupling factor (superfamily II helicase)